VPEAKPLRADARRNRARVLEVAEQTFAAEGLSVPIDTIAERAGVGVGTVYRHFPTKDALFVAIVADRLQRLIDQARELTTADDPGGAFFGFLDDLIDQALANKALVDALSESAAVELADLAQEFSEAEADLLSRAQRAGAVRPDVRASHLKALVSSCLTMVSQAEDNRHLIGIVFDGLRPRPD
jgi:AcrR family transcriptional regulator